MLCCVQSHRDIVGLSSFELDTLLTQPPLKTGLCCGGSAFLGITKPLYHHNMFASRNRHDRGAKQKRQNSSLLFQYLRCDGLGSVSGRPVSSQIRRHQKCRLFRSCGFELITSHGFTVHINGIQNDETQPLNPHFRRFKSYLYLTTSQGACRNIAALIGRSTG